MNPESARGTDAPHQPKERLREVVNAWAM